MKGRGDGVAISFRESLEWDQCSSAFQDWGQLHDIYVPHTTVADWDCLLGVLSAWNLAYDFARGEEDLPIPSVAQECFAQDENAPTSLLSLQIGNVRLNCHFFEEEELELDYSPGAVTDQQSLDAVLNVMRLLGEALQKPVFLSSEGEHDLPIFRYCPETGEFCYFSSVAGRTSARAALWKWLCSLFRSSRAVLHRACW